MPKTQRDFDKRTIAQAALSIEEGMIYLIRIEEKFTPVHPELAEYLTVTLKALDSSIEVIKSFCEKAWGYYPDNWEIWRNLSTSRKRTQHDDVDR